MTLLTMILCAIALLIALPAFVLLLEVLLARSAQAALAGNLQPEEAQQSQAQQSQAQQSQAQQSQAQQSQAQNPARIAVLIPAHNEAAGIAATIRCVAAQLDLGNNVDRIVVIADNCSDDTAQVARANGATAVERTDPHLRGKGYALDFGVRFLNNDPPDVVIVVDADCLLSDGTLRRLTDQAVLTGRPIQARYLMQFPHGSGGPGARIAELALLVKNWVRPQGLAKWGLPCPLLGSGMAFPWPIISKLALASGNIVEDMRMGSDLVAAGLGPRFLSQAQVYSTFPLAVDGQQSQRKRWEHGHLQTLLTQVPKLLLTGVMRADPEIIAYALDLAIPPLALLAMGLFGTFAVFFLGWMLGMTVLPATILFAAILALLLAVLLAWDRFARDLVPAAVLMSVPAYALGKIPVYLKFIFARQTQWVRSRRDSERDVR